MIKLLKKRDLGVGTSQFSDLVFERFRWVFDLVFSSNPVFINLLNYWEG